jgi:hypothetical protein
MTLEVVIRRLPSGLLQANVLQHGQLGSNLLAGRALTNIERAKEAAKMKLWNELRTEVEIVWTVKA